MSSLPHLRYTPEQYLEKERQAEFRSEYVNGEILAMAGASREHNRITLNIDSALTGALAGTPCEPFATDMRVRVTHQRYTYPDVVVAWDAEFDADGLDTLLNPSVIFEIASPSTIPDDRGWKFAQGRPAVEHHTRQDQGKWTLQELNGGDAVLRLPSIGLELMLSEIYARVGFQPDLRMPNVPEIPENSP